MAERAAARAIEKSVEAGGVATKYWFYPAANGAKEPFLIMIHGYRGNHHGLEAQAGGLENLNIIIPDLPGFGESTPLPDVHSVANYAYWLDQFVSALKLPARPIILGHSFGSLIVSEYVTTYPGVAGLILQNPVSAPALDGPKAFLTSISKIFFGLAKILPIKISVKLLKSWPMVRGMSIVMSKTRNRKLRAWIHQQHDNNFNDFANRSVAIEGYQASISVCVKDFAGKFTVPILILAGEKDDITSVEQQMLMANEIPQPNWRLRIIEGVGHLSHYETPEIVAAEINSFVASLSSKAGNH